MRRLAGLAAALAVAGCAPDPPAGFVAEPWPERLSAWRLFASLETLEPGVGVLVYDLNTPLFSDYARKYRTVWLPEGASAGWRDHGVLDLPVGTVLSKTFWYPAEDDGTVRVDAAPGVSGRRRLETRLLVHGTAGWAALPYTWNHDRSEATLRPAGALIALHWSDGAAREGELDYLVPNRDQCAGCHADGRGGLRPIGPTATNLNREIPVADGSLDQLSLWKRRGLLAADVPGSAAVPRMPVWNDPATGDVTERARAYLEVQCAHCHDPARPADASGLLLGWTETRPRALGVCKPPVAAGRGSGGLLYDVVPGRPGESILAHRMRSTEPDVQMPELGRDLRHDEGIALVEKWIAALEGDCGEDAAG